MRLRTTSTAAGPVAGLVLVLCLTACTAPAAERTTTASHGSSASATSVDADTLLADLGLAGLSGKEMVEALESSTEQRPLALTASVREDHVLVGDGDGIREAAVPLPQDELYVSVAPYVERTHECFYHSLATCQGELTGEQVSVVITDDDGQVLVEETVTTQANGFAGFWLPRGIDGGTIEVTHDGHRGSVPLSTTPGSPTCVTTLKLEPTEG